MKSMFRRKNQLTDYTWTTSDVRKYFKNSFFKLKKESVSKYPDLDKTDILFVLTKNYDLDFYNGEDDDEEFKFRYWEDLPDIPVSTVTVDVISKEFLLKREKMLINPEDLLLRKYSSGFFEEDLNLFLVYRLYNGYNYSKGVNSGEYKVRNIVKEKSFYGDSSILRGIFVDYPFNEKILRRKIDEVVNLEKPFNILTKKYALINSDTSEYPVLKYTTHPVGWFDIKENELKVFVDGEVADKLRNLYAKSK